MPKKKTKLGAKLKDVDVGKAKSRQAAWLGPQEEGATQSILADYIVCKERFRVKYIEGLQEIERFNHSIEYGNMWHIAEEHLAAGSDWKSPVTGYCRELCVKYPYQQSDVVKWYQVLLVQFPIYLKYWEKHNDMKTRVPLYQEREFRVDYPLGSGRSVTLRGKLDGIDLLGPKSRRRAFLRENKCKGQIDEASVAKQLRFDLQTMVYPIVVRHMDLDLEGTRFGGVWYNIVRRPLSGGRGSIRPHKAKGKKPAETEDEYYDRLAGIIEEESAYFFMRWTTELTSSDLDLFQLQCLNPLLENLCDDYEWWSDCFANGLDPYDYLDRQLRFPDHLSRHYRLPYGIYNPIAEGRSTDLDEYLDNGSKTGLVYNRNFFPELKS